MIRPRIHAKIRGILLDKDGTILNYGRTWAPINRDVATLAAGGNARLAESLLRLGGQCPLTGRITPGSVLAAGTHVDIAETFAAHLGNLTPPDLAAGIERLFREGGARHAVLLDGAEVAIAELAARGYVIGIATNDTAAGLASSLGRFPELLGRVAFLAGCDSGHGAKPAPGMLAAFCAAVGISAGEIAVVGDSVHDLEMGRTGGAGLNIGVTCGTSPADILAPYADVVLGSIEQLPGWLHGDRS